MKDERKREYYKSNIYHARFNESNKIVRDILKSIIRVKLYINIYDIRFNSERAYNN